MRGGDSGEEELEENANYKMTLKINQRTKFSSILDNGKGFKARGGRSDVKKTSIDFLLTEKNHS